MSPTVLDDATPGITTEPTQNPDSEALSQTEDLATTEKADGTSVEAKTAEDVEVQSSTEPILG